ncbi:MAG: hypothetical protein BM556_14210 [Bacteriovorax sp. MedPE-SWde]|nr:MAG: hypothetical protein BM556_14210 [Bacteriovorax sp. MedPE-SWde]
MQKPSFFVNTFIKTGAYIAYFGIILSMKVSPNLHILVVDDCPIVTKQLKLILRKKGFKKVQIVDNGADALSAMITSRNISDHIQLILLDWNMPKLNGMHFLQKVKEIPEFVNLPVIMVSGNLNEEDISRALQNGAAGYVKKPVIAANLFAEISKTSGQK